MKRILLLGLMAILSLASSAAHASQTELSYRDFGLKGKDTNDYAGSIPSATSDERHFNGIGKNNDTLMETVTGAFGRTEPVHRHPVISSGRGHERKSEDADDKGWSSRHHDRHDFDKRHGFDRRDFDERHGGGSCPPAGVPIPASLVLFGSGLVFAGVLRRRLL